MEVSIKHVCRISLAQSRPIHGYPSLIVNKGDAIQSPLLVGSYKGRQTHFRQSSAQRLIPRQKAIEIYGGVPLAKGQKMFAKEQLALGVGLQRYFSAANYAFLSVDYEAEHYDYKTYAVPCKDVYLQCGYMQPLVSDGGKNVFLYLGTAAVLGYEEVNDDKKVLPDGAALLDGSAFVYGAAVHTSIECFLSDKVLLTLKGQARYIFGTGLNKFRPAVSVGLRFNL